MVKVKIEIPERFDVDKEELSKSIKNFVRLKLARNLMLKRLDTLLKDSEITEEEATALGREVKKDRFETLKRMGYF